MGVGVSVKVGVFVGVLVRVNVLVLDGVNVMEGVRVIVKVKVRVNVRVFVKVGVMEGVIVWEGVCVDVGNDAIKLHPPEQSVDPARAQTHMINSAALLIRKGDRFPIRKTGKRRTSLK